MRKAKLRNGQIILKYQLSGNSTIKGNKLIDKNKLK